MLAALLLLGLLPLAALPMEQGDAEAGSEESDEATEASAPGASTDLSLLDAGPGAEDDAPDEPVVDGETLRFDATPGMHEIEDFETGEDLVELDLSTVIGEISFDMSDPGEAATVSFSVGSEVTTTLVFDGLTEVPTGDIMLRLTEEGSDQVVSMSLGDAIALNEITEMGPEMGQEPAATSADDGAQDGTGDEVSDPVDPTDPTLPDEPGPEVTDPPLDPTDPELPDPPGPDDIVGPVLDPVDDDTEIPADLSDMELRDLIERDSANQGGMADVLAAADDAGVVETALGDDDDSLALDDDGVAGTGTGEIGLSQAAPLIDAAEPIEVVDGGAGDDSITGGDGAAYVFGGEGNDTLEAGEGAAAYFGGAGEDVLQAGPGGAYLDGGTGDDTLSGGAGDDLLEGGEHGSGMAGDDLIDGGAGDDSIRGGYGADTLLGGDGDDVIDHLGHTEERVTAEHHEFAWHTDGEADRLEGGDGDDTLIFDGADVAAGGAGQDLFWLYSDGATTPDVARIEDFVVGEDFLRVSLNPQIGENDEPLVEVQTSANGADGLVFVNGDLVAVLQGAPGASPSDIYAEVAPDVFPMG